MLILAISYIVFFVVCVLLLNYCGATERQDKILWGVMAFALAMIAFLFDPTGTGLDVERHFQRIEVVKNANITFDKYVLRNSFGYSGMYVFNAICYFIARLNISNHILPFSVTLVSYAICFYILRDWAKQESIDRRYYALSVLIGFAFLPYYFVMCGIRNGVAMCIMGLAVYQYLYKRKRFLTFLLLGAIAATIHTSVLIAVPFVLLSGLRLSYKSIGLVFIGSFVLGTVARALSKMSVPYLSEMAKSYLVYSSEGQFRSAQYFLTTDIILIILFAVLLYFQYSKYLIPQNEGHSIRLYSFIALYGAYVVGNFGNYDLVLRPAYLFGPLSPMLGYLLYNGEYWKGKAGVQFLVKTFVLLLCGYTVARYMAFFFTSVSF